MADTKGEKLHDATVLFTGTSIKITTDGKRHLGAAIGSEDFKISYIEDKVDEWCKRVMKLADIAKSQPQAAYAGYIFGEQHKFMRTLPNIADTLKRLDDVIANELIPSLFGTNISANEREILSLLIRDGGLGVRILNETSSQAYESSRKITTPLTKRIVSQSQQLPNEDEVVQAKSETLSTNRRLSKQKQETVAARQTSEMKRNIEQLA